MLGKCLTHGYGSLLMLSHHQLTDAQSASAIFVLSQLLSKHPVITYDLSYSAAQ